MQQVPLESCSIVGIFGIVIQLILGILSFSALILKRFYQNPKRPWLIWRYDTTKQIFSQVLAHFFNVTISMVLTVQKPTSNTCLWYLTTNIFDNTMGAFICIFMLRKLETVLIDYDKLDLVSGNYYEYEKNEEIQSQGKEQDKKIIINSMAWRSQLAIWNTIVIISKIVLFILQLCFISELEYIFSFFLAKLESSPNLEAVFVIVIIPVFMNGLVLWVQDGFLQKRDLTEEIQKSHRQSSKRNQNFANVSEEIKQKQQGFKQLEQNTNR